ncbi:uncharacterized protein LOC142223398 isoform X2 [Haematobia irritans]|uniref:uncharacterized protein LOC142223398 isoform X2 n=1 Tax=Haematobia irritans TaxID=7368 RepID=UPI003F4F6E1E
MDPQKISELAKLLRNNGDKILSCESALTLSGSLLRALNDAFTLIADSLEVGEVQNFQVLKPMNSKPPVFRDLQLIHDFIQKTALLCLVHYPSDEYFGKIDITKFVALKRLEVQKVDIKQLAGIQRLRGQLEHLICVKSLKTVDDIITHCGGDNSNGFVWNELKSADFSYNNLKCVDTSLEFAQYLQHLNLRHNHLTSVQAIKWLPHLKTLDLSFNRLTQIPQFHMDACKRLQSLNMSNNLLEDLMGIVKLDALTDLDLSDNFLLDHTFLLPLSALITLKFLSLFGNPLHCHPKHRLVTCQYLHKNCSTVKFVLDFDTLSKSEKSVTGTYQLRQVGALNRYALRSSSTSISTAGGLTPLRGSNTPASSVGSLLSFKLGADNSSDTDVKGNESSIVKQKKKASKTRCVEIEDQSLDNGKICNEAAEDVMHRSTISTNKHITFTEEHCKEHLETKRQIVKLREKYGNDWLHSGNAERLYNGSPRKVNDMDLERQKSREMFEEYIKDVTGDFTSATDSQNLNATVHTSTPTNEILDNTLTQLTMSPIKTQSETSDTSIYKSLDQTQTIVNNTETNSNVDQESTVYKSLDESKNSKNTTNPFDEDEDNNDVANNDNGDDVEKPSEKDNDVVVEEEEDDRLKYVYSSKENDEDEFSEREEDEETYIVYTTNRNEAIFLTKSSNFLRERDPLTEKTLTKWSLKILESCDRIKSNTLRINFDTVKVDKQERVYTVEEDLCQELEKKLRDILSQRDLTEMNQTIYRCVNCNCQFSQEIKNTKQHFDIRCPDCKSTFIAEIHEIPKSLEKAATTSLVDKLSPASIVEELPANIVPLSIQDADSNSIGSATSLNESSCSKITTTNSESSFNSNQSLVGSTNTDRDMDFRTNGESDVDIISNPSQSSIEVLDNFASRKTSEERRISHIPNLETIDDQSYTQTFLEREFDNMINFAAKDHPEEYIEKLPREKHVKIQNPSENDESSRMENGAKMKKSTTSNSTQNNLTESSSSGSVTDSICTTYEQKDKTDATTEFLQQEVNDNSKKDGSNNNLSMLSAFMHSTSMLMTSSKKLIDTEKLSNIKSGTPLPTTTNTASINSATTTSATLYKFNYTDFNDIDHRLKLYFYQTKFEEQGEHFKWIVKGQIYNENTKQLCEGCVVVSTCKIYLMEIFGEEHDDVTKWLKPIITCTIDRLETIQLLPWKIGLSFHLRDWGGFLLLLQDILRTDSLLLFFANNSLPTTCDLIYKPNETIVKRLNSAIIDEHLNMCSVLNGCEITCENAKRSFNICCLLTTDSRLYLSTQNVGWLSLGTPGSNDNIELSVTQFMSNLVEVEHHSENIFIMQFMDETQDKNELWKCEFETVENANTCLNAIAQSWEKLFGVPLIST